MTIRRMYRAASLAALLFALLLAPRLPSVAFANDGLGGAKHSSTGLPPQVEAGLDYLLQLTKTPGLAFDAGQVQALLELVADSGPDVDRLSPAKRGGASGITMRIDLKCSLSRLLRYGYNPDLPTYALLPSVVRVSSWLPGSDLVDKNLHLWERLDQLAGPEVFRGREQEVNTPDSFGGGYYSYQLNRLLVLMKFRGKNVLISASSQNGPSSVGKKGVVLNDASWDYFYSDKNGLTKGGIGWMDTYMYDSMTVNVFMEQDAKPPLTVSVLFKWLRAGWAGLNPVQPSHIREGSERYARAFKAVLESNRLPDPETFAGKVREFRAMSDQELDKTLAPYQKAMEEAGKANPVVVDNFPDLLKDGRYTRSFTREERISILVKEYMKTQMGMQSPLNGFFVQP